MTRVLIAAGGTGGHLFPAMQLGKALSDCTLLFAGHQLRNSPFFGRDDFPFEEIASHPLGRGFCTACWQGLRQSLTLIRTFQPDVVVGFGSYHTVPVLLAAVILRKKIFLFEANSGLGRVNRLFAPFAHRIAFQFPVRHRKAILVQWLPWDEARKRPLFKKGALEHYCLDPMKKTALVFGGSQGASFFNEHAPRLFSDFHKQIQVIHLTGGATEEVAAAYAQYQVSARVLSFEHNMSMAYSAADVALCRSGAGTVAELLHFHLPALLIPYPFAMDDHQRKNGEYLVSQQVARMIVQKEATEDRLLEEWKALMQKEEEMRSLLQRYCGGKRVSMAELVR